MQVAAGCAAAEATRLGTAAAGCAPIKNGAVDQLPAAAWSCSAARGYLLQQLISSLPQRLYNHPLGPLPIPLPIKHPLPRPKIQLALGHRHDDLVPHSQRPKMSGSVVFSCPTVM